MSNQNEATPIVAMFGNVYNSPVVDLLPLSDIPVECEDEPVHTAENGYVCGDPTCYCASGNEEVQ
jgi:hypothetical protein